MDKKEKKLVGALLALVFIVGVALGAYFYFDDTGNSAAGTATITVIDLNGVVAEEELEFEEDQTLLELMETHFDAEHEDAFIYSIEGIEQDMAENQFWVYEVNDEQVMVGAAEYFLEDGDVVVWELTQF